MPSRFILIIICCITLCFTAVATAQNGRFPNSRRYIPSQYYPGYFRRAPRLSVEQMNRIYGPSILVPTKQKTDAATQPVVVQPR